MTFTTKPNTLQPLLVAALTAGAALSARALNYTSTDLLLVFRQDGQKDVEFDLGSVSNYLGHVAGTQIPVNYTLNAVKTNFNNSFYNVRFGIVGTTSQLDPLPRIWVTDATVYSGPADLTFSRFSQLSSKIDSVGVNAGIYTASNAAPYIVSTAASSSYDYLVTYGTLASVATMNGDSPSASGSLTPLPVDAVNPTTIALYEVVVSTSNPKPAATMVGAFTMDVNGNLTFTAGTLPPLPATRITSVNNDSLGGVTTVSFNTSLGRNYQLLYSTTVNGGWAPVPGAGVVNGDGTVQSLYDYNAADPTRFYLVQTTY